jgi:CO/xanthine dehydrogenase Mo-binding subunit
MISKYKVVGKSKIRKDTLAKVTGKALYAADIPADNICIGMLIRSSHHHAQIVSINKDSALKIPGVLAVISSEDIPGAKTYGALEPDQPALAVDVVRHMGEPIILIIAESQKIAEAAIKEVNVELQELPVIHDPVEALKSNSLKIHPNGNLLTQFDFEDGDLHAGFSNSDVILEESFNVPRISPGYMEPENSLASWNDDESITVWVSSQKPHDDRDQIASVLNIPPDRVQVKSAVIGGAFGGKEDASIQILASLGAYITKSTVRLVNRRQDSFVGHPKRHPALMEYKIGARNDGTLLALEATVFLDTGAYASYGPAVGSLLTEMLSGSYAIPNVHVNTQVVYTNNPLSGAMRGFGSPQAHFALESMIDILAAELNIDPLDLRRKNILKPGDKFFTHVELNNTASSLPKCLDHAEAALKQLSQVPASPGKISGVGMALGMQSMGLGAKVADLSTHRLEWAPDGSVLLYLGAADLGQGLAAAAEQITAEALGLPFESVTSVDLDTMITPNGGVTCASRMTYMTGNAVIVAADLLKQNLLYEASKMLSTPLDQLSYQDGMVICPDGSQLKVEEFTGRAVDAGVKIQAEGSFLFPYPEETTPQHLPIGMPHVIFCFAAQVARVEIDPELGTVEVKDIVAIHDVGKAINPTGVEGQIEGGVATGIGYALYENVALKEDNQWVNSFSEYLLATAKDMPNIQTIILEIPEASGPYGVKGIGESVLVPTAPAITNAVYNALGKRITSIPINPEDLL